MSLLLWDPWLPVLSQQALHLMPTGHHPSSVWPKGAPAQSGALPHFKASHFRADGTRLGKQHLWGAGKVLLPHGSRCTRTVDDGAPGDRALPPRRRVPLVRARQGVGEACNRAKRNSHPSRVFPVNLRIYLRGWMVYYSFFTAEESEGQI